MNILLLFGITLLITIVVSFVFVRLHLPQVIGYILVGIILGISGIQLFDSARIDHLNMVTYFALSMIGFTIGGELRWARIKRFGASIIIIITFFESTFSCLIVFCGIYFLTFNLPLALLLGGLACATAPGGTTNVIQEYKARGQLTSTLYGVVGADDAFAIIIFFLSGISKALVGVSDSIHVFTMISHVISDIGGALLLGSGLGLFASFWMLYVRSSDVRHLMTLVFIFICAGLSISIGVSLILSSMMMGIIVANIRPHRARSCFLFLFRPFQPRYTCCFLY